MIQRKTKETSANAEIEILQYLVRNYTKIAAKPGIYNKNMQVFFDQLLPLYNLLTIRASFRASASSINSFYLRETVSFARLLSKHKPIRM